MMMTETLTRENVKYIIARLIDNANDAAEEYKKDKSNKLLAGRKLAYYEMLDILRTELDVRDEDLEEFGLDIDLEKTYA
ncbi:MAG: transposase [Lachnospiraceae bacterium]|nr:transposase [Lachnospiraceae bacterium]